MRKLYFCLLMAIIPLLACAQKLVKNEVDRFTKLPTKETNWNKLVFKGAHAVRVMARNVDNSVTLHFKIAEHKIMSVQEGDYVLLLLNDGNTVTMKISAYDVSKANYGYQRTANFESLEIPTYPLSLKDISALQNNSVKAIRIYLGGRDQLEYNVDKFATAIKQCIYLVM